MKKTGKFEKAQEAKPKKKRKGWLIVLLVILGLLLAVVLTVYGIFHSKYSLVYEPETEPAATEPVQTPEDLEQHYEQIVDVTEEEVQMMEDATQDLEETEVVEATGDVVWDDDVYNILLIGTDERTKGKYSAAARGDVCMLLSINISGDAPVISLVSFERGMGVPILDGAYKGKWDWLTHTFRYGGAKLITREIRECFKVDVDHYVRINFSMFKEAINALGGVTVNISSAEAVYFQAAGFTDIQAGDRKLNGEQALYYARLRELDSDWVRIRRQREIVEACLVKLKTMPVDKILKLMDTILPLVKTNIPESKIAELMLLLPKIKDLKVQQMTIPKKGTYGSMKGMGGRTLYSVDFETNAQILKEFLYPQLTEEAVPAE